MDLAQQIANLEEKREALKVEYRGLEIEIAATDMALEILHKVSRGKGNPGRARASTGNSGSTVKEAIAEVLFQHGSEMHRKDIMAALVTEDVYPGEDPSKEMRYMASHLSADRRFEKAGNPGSGIWQLTDEARAEMMGDWRK